MRIFIISDTHFNHTNIINYCNRPFHTVDEMNNALIKAWNSAVGQDDLVLFLGDFLFAKNAVAYETTSRFAAMLNGRKIIIKGNHDYRNFRYCDAGFNYECYQAFDFGRFLFVHRPDELKKWSNSYDFVFFGHVHNSCPMEQYINTINVCADVLPDFKPMDITNYFTTKEISKLESIIGLNENNTL